MYSFKEDINLSLPPVLIRRPSLDETDLIRKLWTDIDTMADVGGTVDCSAGQMKDWFSRIMDRQNIRDNYFIIFADSQFAGEISFHRYNADRHAADFNIKILDNLRGHGYSVKAMACFFYYVFEIIGLNALYDELYSENERGIKVLEKMGFCIKSVKRRTVEMIMHKADYFSSSGETGNPSVI